MSDEIPLGSDAAAVAQGWTPIKDQPAEPEALTVKEAAERLTESRPETPDDSKITVPDPETGDPLEGNFAITAEQAARALSDRHRIEAADADALGDIDFVSNVVDRRAEVLGLSLNRSAEDGAAEHPGDGKPSQDAPEGAAEGAEAPAVDAKPDDSPEGVSARVRELLAMPEVSAALEHELGQAQQMREQYAQEIGNAHKFAAAAVWAMAPELASVPPEHLGGALQMMARQNPQRHAAVMNQINVAAHLQQRGMAIEHQLAQERQAKAEQQFADWSAEQDAAFMKARPEFADPKQAAQMRSDVMSYLTDEVGIPKEALPKLWQNEIFRDAYSQRIVADAASWHKAKQRARNAVQRELPPVQRPGVPRGRGADRAEEISRLSAGLPNMRGTDALRAATKLMQAKRESRR